MNRAFPFRVPRKGAGKGGGDGDFGGSVIQAKSTLDRISTAHGAESDKYLIPALCLLAVSEVPKPPQEARLGRPLWLRGVDTGLSVWDKNEPSLGSFYIPTPRNRFDSSQMSCDTPQTTHPSGRLGTHFGPFRHAIPSPCAYRSADCFV